MYWFFIYFLRSVGCIAVILWFITNLVMLFAGGRYPITAITMTVISLLAICVANAWMAVRDRKSKHDSR